MSEIGRMNLPLARGRSESFALDDEATAIGGGEVSLRAGSRPRAGALSVVCSAASDEPTVAMAATAAATQPMMAAFHAELESAELSVYPYSRASVLVRIENCEREERRFRLETAGPAAAWTSPERLAFAVDGDDSLEVLLHVAPQRRSDLRPGDYPLKISLRQLDGQEDALQLALTVRLGGFAGLSAALDPPNLGARSRFQLRLINLGNQEIRLRLRAREADRRLNIRLAQDELRLGAGDKTAISGMVEARRRPLVGAPREIALALLVQARPPQDYVLSLPATVALEPILQKRAFIALAFVITVLILALAALLFLPPLP